MEAVYREHLDRVEALVRVALARAGRLTGANLADVVQDVFVKAFAPKARAAYDGSRDYSPYLMAIARNVLVDWLRANARDTPSAGDPEALLQLIDSAAESDEGAIFDAELIQAVESYLQGLPPALQAVHEQRFVAAEPQERAAATLGISRQTLRTLERKIVAGLRRQILRARLREASGSMRTALAPNTGEAP